MKSNLFRTLSMTMVTTAALYAQGSSALDLNSPLDSTTANPKPMHYTVTDLGPVGGPPGQPFVIRNNGLVSGAAAFADNVLHAVLWYAGFKIDIGRPGLGGPNSAAIGVNEWGQTVGQAQTSKPDPRGEDFCGFGTQLACRPFVWQLGSMTALPTLVDGNGTAGNNGIANSINNRAQIAGVSENTVRDATCPPFNPPSGQLQQFQFKPVIWESGKIRELPTIAGDPDGIAFAINDSGQAAGATGTCTVFQANGDLTYLYGLHATFWDNGKVTDLGNLGGIGAGGGNAAVNINNQGQVVGISGTADGGFTGFLWSKATGMKDIGAVAGDVASVALGINDRGDVTGISFDPGFNPRAFVRRNGGTPVDLNSLIPADSPLFLFDACSINSRGEIIGIGVNAAGEAHGFLAVPSRTSTNAMADSVNATNSAQFEIARKLLRQQVSFGQFGARPIFRR